MFINDIINVNENKFSRHEPDDKIGRLLSFVLWEFEIDFKSGNLE